MCREPNLYEGVYYCVHCGRGEHLVNIMKTNARCDECGGSGFISTVDFDINNILKRSDTNE
ncbi:MAG: hypothetical protein PHH85_02030 [Candidatus Methanoperedens sp.]|nr:hypothetical protein [Candidatus Methanoperedens sp.]